jgi:quercetin dioxygenase-like cupin family protein
MSEQQATLEPRLVLPGEGRLLSAAAGGKVIQILGTAHTGDRLSIDDYTMDPGLGPPLHKHTHEDEVFHILQGEATFHVGGKVLRAPAGATVFGPRGVPHTFANLGTTPMRMLLMVTPPGSFERFYGIIGAMMPDGSPPSAEVFAERIAREAPKFGIEMLGPNPLG